MITIHEMGLIVAALGVGIVYLLAKQAMGRSK